MQEINGRELRQRRTKLGMTQEDMGAALGVAWNTIARWERGELQMAHPMMIRVMLERIEANRQPIKRASAQHHRKAKRR